MKIAKLAKLARSLSNLGLRASTLVFRFALSFYIIKYLGLDASGIYGLGLGLISIMPALVGWGLNYFVAREVVGQPPEFAGMRVKTRLLVTTISLALVSVLGVSSMMLSGMEITGIHLLILVLIWLETYALDVHMPMIAQEMAIQANVLVFIRSALWCPFVIGAGILFPPFRTIEWVFLGWILSYIPAVVALYLFVRHWPLPKIAATPVDYPWIRARLKTSWFIYISDLSIVGLMYADRYIVNFVLGLTLTGVYTFLWSLTNSLQTLITTAVVHVALPILFKAYSQGTLADWKLAMRQQLLKTAAFSAVLAVGVFVAGEVLIQLMGMQQLSEHRLLFSIMLLAAAIRCCSDLLNIGLTSVGKDNHYASINLAGVLLAMGLAYVMMRLFGLDGAGYAALLTALIIAAIRGAYLVKFARALEKSRV